MEEVGRKEFDTLKGKLETYMRRMKYAEAGLGKIALHGTMVHRHSVDIRADGEAMRYLFPTPGKINKIHMRVPGASKKTPIRITVELWHGSVAKSQVLLAEQSSIAAQVDLDVEEGDRLLVLSADLTLHDFEIAFFFVPNAKALQGQVDLSIFGDYVDERIRTASRGLPSSGATPELSESN